MVSPAEKRRSAEPGAAAGAAVAESARRPAVETSRLVRLCVAAWLIPGLGHWLLKKRARAAILFFAIIGMFVFGVLMQGQFFAMASPSYLERLGYLGELCVGLAMPCVKFFGYSGGNPFFVSADYGTAYLITAGMLNLLAILDTYDIALHRKP